MPIAPAFKAGGAAATGAAAAKARAERLLSAPLRKYADHDVATCKEEAAHALLACVLGYRIGAVTGSGGKVIMSRENPWRPSWKSDMQMIALGGLAKEDAVTSYRSCESWGELEARMSAADFDGLWQNTEMAGSQQALKSVREAMILARGLLAIHSRGLARLTDALARHGVLRHDDVAALIEPSAAPAWDAWNVRPLQPVPGG